MKGEISVKLTKSFYSCKIKVIALIRFLRGVSKVTIYICPRMIKFSM